ncbi:MAG: hypothetical protein AB8I08_12680 [Sandaracinaceae bacterium]
MKVAALALLLLTGCVTDRVLAVEVRPPRDATGGPAIPEDVVSWELWLERLSDGQGCGAVEDAASGRAFGEPAAMQVFDDTLGMGMAFGEIPEGRWSLRALARTAGCDVRLYGCTEFALGEAAPATVSVPVEAVAPVATCGCRGCAEGVCGAAEVCP